MKLIFLLAALLFAAPAEALTFYVTKTGSDSNTCTQAQTLATAKLTINAGLDCMTDGNSDIVLVRTGTYVEDLFRVIRNGTSGSYSRVAAYPGSAPFEVVTVRPTTAGSGDVNAVAFGLNADTSVQQAYIEIDGIIIDGSQVDRDAVKINWAGGWYAHHIRLKNCEIISRHDSANTHTMGVYMSGGTNIPSELSDGGRPVVGNNEIINCKIHQIGKGKYDQAIYVSSSNNTFDNVEVYDFASGCFEFYNEYLGASAVENNVVKNSRCHHPYTGTVNPPTGTRGFLILGNNNTVYNSIADHLIYGNGEEPNAFWIYGGDNNNLWNNTSANNAGCSFVIGYDGTVNGTNVRNNISFNSGTCVGGNNNYWDRNSANTTHTFNLEGIDPLFTDAANGDYTLQNGSPAIDAGTTIATTTPDRVGTVRPQGMAYDIGAFEATSGGGGGGGSSGKGRSLLTGAGR